MTEPRNAEDFKGKGGVRRIINAAGYSRDGLCAALGEAAVRQLLMLHVPLLLLVFFLDRDTATKMVLVFASFFSLIVELFNTAIEAAVDHTSLARHPLAKRAKDIGSAAQLVALLLLALLWGMALLG
ncbi:MAG: diacylglycerol kinase [Cardiobacteriaceae bacterium]|nr:diacylglycerol kinase [Cardiobacteriaceae bacterium]